MTLTEKTVREIAIESPAAVRVFEAYKIDYCCGGSKSLAEACQAVHAAPTDVAQKLDEAIAEFESAQTGDQPENKSAAELVAHIVEKHHTFAKRELTRLQPLMDKVSQKHGAKHPELKELRERLELLRNDLLPHMEKEETILFPYIEKLDIDRTGAISTVPFGTVKNPIRMMTFEHEAAGAILKGMRALANDYKAPPGACPSFNALYFGLEELERDLHLHIHLENNVLFPKAVLLESSDD